MEIGMKISELTEVAKLQGEEFIPMQVGGENYKLKISHLLKEANEINISSINGMEYDLQGAITALDAYLVENMKKVGIKVTFVSSVHHKAETWMYQGGAFTTPASWSNQPSGGYQRVLAEKLGATFNEVSGYYERNGLTDITTDEMNNMVAAHLSTIMANSFAGYLSSKRSRTNLSTKSIEDYSRNFGDVDCRFLGNTNEDLEVFRCNPITVAENSFSGVFTNCRKLKKVECVFNISRCNSKIIPFTNDTNLTHFRLKNLRADIKLNTLSNADFDSLAFLIKEATPSNSITITVETSRYSLLKGTATAEEYQATGHAKKEWMKIDTDAVSKQISFADGGLAQV